MDVLWTTLDSHDGIDVVSRKWHPVVITMHGLRIASISNVEPMCGIQFSSVIKFSSVFVHYFGKID